jgi:WXG100 family type VII secretion target
VIGVNFPVEAIELLAGRLSTEQTKLASELSSLRSACQRDSNFSGSAAVKYDEFLAQWDAHQKGLLEALEGVGRILSQLATHLQQIDSAAAQAFNV